MLRTLFFSSIVLLLAYTAAAQTTRSPFTKVQQNQLKAYEDTLGMLGFVIMNDSSENERFGATRLMIPTLVSALKIPNSFKYPFERLKSVSIQYAPDSTFRIFTWQLFVNDTDYRYYGAIQMNTPELKLFPLIDRSFNLENPQQGVLKPDSWYGALYYAIQKLEDPQQPYYLLMGYDGFSFFRRRKVLDVLSFQDGNPVFGASIIPETVSDSLPRQRMILEYSASASVRLNWDAALELIVFDHLIPIDGAYGEGEVLVPDGSYEAFRIEKGKLVYIPMLETQLQLEPPRPSPVLDDKSKDILGKPTKKN